MSKSILPLKDESGVYKIKCDAWEAFYIGRPGRCFYKRYLEHIPKANNNKAIFAQHLISRRHKCTSFEKTSYHYIYEKG